MKNFHQYYILVQRGKSGRKTDKTVAKKNPKIDRRLLAEYERLIAPLKGVIQIKQGADCKLAHPLARKDMPTDACHRGKRANEIKCTR